MTTNISYKIKKVIISKIKNLNISNELEILELPIDSNKKYFIDIKNHPINRGKGLQNYKSTTSLFDLF